MTTKVQHGKRKVAKKKATVTERLARLFMLAMAVGIAFAIVYVVYSRFI